MKFHQEHNLIHQHQKLPAVNLKLEKTKHFLPNFYESTLDITILLYLNINNRM